MHGTLYQQPKQCTIKIYEVRNPAKSPHICSVWYPQKMKKIEKNEKNNDPCNVHEIRISFLIVEIFWTSTSARSLCSPTSRDFLPNYPGGGEEKREYGSLRLSFRIRWEISKSNYLLTEIDHDVADQMYLLLQKWWFPTSSSYLPKKMECIGCKTWKKTLSKSNCNYSSFAFRNLVVIFAEVIGL